MIVFAIAVFLFYGAIIFGAWCLLRAADKPEPKPPWDDDE